MPDLTTAKSALYNATRVVNKGADQTLRFLRYSNSAVYDLLIPNILIEENFRVSSSFNSRVVEGRQVGGESEILELADVDGNLYGICQSATGCVVDNIIYKLSIKSKPRVYTNDDTDFTRVWEWFLTDTGDTYNG